MYCIHCGATMNETEQFCPVCGKPNSSAKAENPQSAVGVAPSQSHPPANFPAPGANGPVGAQNPYQQPVPPMGYVNNNINKTEPVPTIGQYLGWFLVGAIPLVGWIIAIVFAVNGEHKARANFFRAQIILAVICGVLSGIITAILMTAGLSFFSYMNL